jgi:prophage regulatory protein
MSPKIIIGIDDRFVGRKELQSLLPYTVNHLRLLELAGEFPVRIRIGANRAAWLEREVREWIEAKRMRTREEEGDA